MVHNTRAETFSIVIAVFVFKTITTRQRPEIFFFPKRVTTDHRKGGRGIKGRPHRSKKQFNWVVFVLCVKYIHIQKD